MKPVVVQKWEESERGWGVRPDGYSIHKTQQDAEEYVAQYWERMPDYVPDEYSRPSGRTFVADVTDEEYAQLTDKIGVRFYEIWNERTRD